MTAAPVRVLIASALEPEHVRRIAAADPRPAYRPGLCVPVSPGLSRPRRGPAHDHEGSAGYKLHFLHEKPS
jgi:hypothetical protein